MKKDYHRILGIGKNADKDEIKQAYRKLAKKFHPDINRSEGADEIFIEVSEAYEMLINQPDIIKNDTEDEEEINHQEIWQEIRDRAQQQAQMKYEKFIKEHEAFKASGVYDVFLFFKIILRSFILILTFILYVTPFVLFFIEKYLILTGLIFWTFAVLLTMFIYEKRKRYFVPGKFYYNIKRIREYINETNENSGYACFYRRNEKADSKPYKIYLLKIKDIKFDNIGPLYHNAHYKRIHKTVKIPRSRKALKVHVVSSVIKFISLFIIPFFIPVHSFLWRMFMGLAIGFVLSSIFLVLMRTRSKVSYLLNPAMLLKVAIWFFILILCTDFSNGFMNLYTKEIIKPVYGILIFFDPFFEMIIKSFKNNLMIKPILKEYRELDKYFEKKYQYYLDIPLWTIFYPLFKWIFG